MGIVSVYLENMMLPVQLSISFSILSVILRIIQYSDPVSYNEELKNMIEKTFLKIPYNYALKYSPVIPNNNNTTIDMKGGNILTGGGDDEGPANIFSDSDDEATTKLDPQNIPQPGNKSSKQLTPNGEVFEYVKANIINSYKNWANIVDKSDLEEKIKQIVKQNNFQLSGNSIENLNIEINGLIEALHKGLYNTNKGQDKINNNKKKKKKVKNYIPYGLFHVFKSIISKNIGFDEAYNTGILKTEIHIILLKIVAYIVLITSIVFSYVYDKNKNIPRLKILDNFVTSSNLIIAVAVLLFIMGVIGDVINLILNSIRLYTRLTLKTILESDDQFYKMNLLTFLVKPEVNSDDLIQSLKSQTYNIASNKEGGIQIGKYCDSTRNSVLYDIDTDIYDVKNNMNIDDKINTIATHNCKILDKVLTDIMSTNDDEFNKSTLLQYIFNRLFSKSCIVNHIFSFLILYLISSACLHTTYTLFNEKLKKSNNYIKMSVVYLYIITISALLVISHIVIIYVIRSFIVFVVEKIFTEKNKFIKSFITKYKNLNGIFLGSDLPYQLSNKFQDKDIKIQEIWSMFSKKILPEILLLLIIFLTIFLIVLLIIINDYELYRIANEDTKLKYRVKYINISNSLLFVGLFIVLIIILLKGI